MDEQGDTVRESNSRPVFRDVVPRAPFIEDVKDFIGGMLLLHHHALPTLVTCILTCVQFDSPMMF